MSKDQYTRIDKGQSDNDYSIERDSFDLAKTNFYNISFKKNVFNYINDISGFKRSFDRHSVKRKVSAVSPIPVGIIEDPETDEASNYIITSTGLVEERWNSIEYIQARVLEVTKNAVILECIVDIENRVFENRKFERTLLEGVVPFAPEKFVMITIFRRPGEIKFKFINGANLVNPKLFEEDKYFSTIDPNAFSKKL